LPNKTTFDDLSFDLGLSSHFLLLYSQLGLDFHLASIKEMLRVCKEVRIFPLVNLNSEPSELLNKVIDHFQKEYVPTIENVNYEFQKGGNEMLRITRI
jgi:ubiquinone/menaquinone biosynthesis C-methylase UbiE